MTPVVVAIVQFLLAATFVVIPVVGAATGPRAQRAAEAEVARQGHAVAVLAEHKVDFGAGRASVVLAIAIGVLFAVVAALNLAGVPLGETLTWIVQPIMLLLGLTIMPGEVFTTRFLASAFGKAEDPAIRSIDVKAFVDAARSAYPAWAPAVIAARFGLATAGSILVIVLLAVT